MCLLIFTCAIAGVYLYYSTVIPDTCNKMMSTYFFGAGIIGCVTAVVLAVMSCGMAEVFSAASHAELMKKYQKENRLEEAAEQEEEAEKEASTAAMIMTTSFCCVALIQLVSLGWLIFGIVQAVGADSSLCGDSVTVFWVLLALQVLNMCMSSCKGGAGVSGSN